MKPKRKWLPGGFDFINFRIQSPLLEKMLFHPPGMQKGLKGLAMLFKAANLPLVSRFHPWVQSNKTRTFVLPVDKTVALGENVVQATIVLEVCEGSGDAIHRSLQLLITLFRIVHARWCEPRQQRICSGSTPNGFTWVHPHRSRSGLRMRMTQTALGRLFPRFPERIVMPGT